MKNIILNSVALLSLCLVLVGCKKSCEKFDTYFYTDIETQDDSLSLSNTDVLTFYLDGENKGTLKNLKTRFAPNNDTILTNALHLVLEAGSYKIEAKDNSGNVKIEGKLKFKSNSMRVHGTRGGHAVSSSGSIIVNKLSY